MTPNIFRRVLATLIITILAIPHAALAAQTDVVNAVNQIRLSDPNVPVGTPNPRGLMGNIIDNMFYPTGPKQGKIRPEYLDITTSSVAGTLIDLNSQGTAGYFPKYTGTGITLGNSAIFESGGNIGIGTVSPAEKLDVAGIVKSNEVKTSSVQAGYTTGYNQHYTLLTSVANGIVGYRPTWILGIDVYNWWGNLNIWAPSFDKLGTHGPVRMMSFFTGDPQSALDTRSATPALKILENQNVGIGTATPSYKLDVVGTINASALRLPNGSGLGKVLTSDAAGLATWATILPSATSGQTLRYDGASWVASSNIYNDGTNVGIWGVTTPSANIDISSTGTGQQLSLRWPSIRDYSLDFSNKWNGVGMIAQNAYIDGLVGSWPSATLKYTRSYSSPNNVWARWIMFWYPSADSMSFFNESFPASMVAYSAFTPSISMTISGGWNVGIGTSTPSYKLDVVGTINASALRLPNGSGSGRILTSDASGLASWTTPSSSGWWLTGNAGTSSNTNFIGTTDNQSIVFKINNTQVGRLGNTTDTNVYFGMYSGQNSNTATNNVAIGYGTLMNAASTTNRNVAIGVQALRDTTTGTNNTAVGYSALYMNTTGTGNTAIGHSAMNSVNTGADNTAIGQNTLYSNLWGASNTAVGWAALYANTSGNFNTANGAGALRFNSSGVGNTANGYYAIRNNASGNYNSALGQEAGNGTGGGNYSNNSLVGYRAGYILSTGSANSIFGTLAGNTLSTGGTNTLIGFQAAQNLTSGSGNIVIGDNIYAPAAASVNTLNIGNLIYGTGLDGALGVLSTGSIGIGTTAPSEKFEVNGNIKATAFYYSSDRRLKQNITPLDNSLDKILSLNGYSFDWIKDGRKDIGVIAQEVEAVYPELVKTDAQSGLKSVEYANLVGPLIEAIKEQDKQIKELKAEVESMKKSGKY